MDRRDVGAVFSTAAQARSEARLALDNGAFGQAADCYLLAAKRLGNEVVPVIGTQALFPHVLKACATAATRLATEENQKVKRVLVSETTHTVDEAELGVLLGVRFSEAAYLEEPTLLTRQEQLLLFLDRPLAARNTLVYFAEEKRRKKRPCGEDGIVDLFVARYLAAQAETGDVKHMQKLATMAVCSAYNYRALEGLAQRKIPGAALQMTQVDINRHSIFLNLERNRKELRDQARRLLDYRFPHF